jgi:hypothetical protein
MNEIDYIEKIGFGKGKKSYFVGETEDHVYLHIYFVLKTFDQAFPGGTPSCDLDYYATADLIIATDGGKYSIEAADHLYLF